MGSMTLEAQTIRVPKRVLFSGYIDTMMYVSAITNVGWQLLRIAISVSIDFCARFKETRTSVIVFRVIDLSVMQLCWCARRSLTIKSSGSLFALLCYLSVFPNQSLQGQG